MRDIPEQLTMMNESAEYTEFVEKFKPKKTTDECHTPPAVYEAVLGWVCDYYGVDRADVVRPFYPGGDYERYSYENDSVVVDNPPFSILMPIIRFYNEHQIKYFLFAPYLTNFTSGLETCHIITDSKIIYENGANVNTCFVTNLDNRLVYTAIDLRNRIIEATKDDKPKLPKYDYPAEVLTATMVGYLANKGIEYELAKEDATFIRKLDAQAPYKKTLFGGGFLISEKAAAEKAAAEKAAELVIDGKHVKTQDGVIRFELSEREREIIKLLGR